MQIYIVAIIVSIVLVAILFFVLRSTVKRIDYNTKKYFVDKLQDYDYLIEQKQQILNELDKRIEENKNILSKVPNNEQKIVKEKERRNYQNLGMPKYVDQDLFKKYKDIKEKFNFDYKNIIVDFVEKFLTEESNEYKIAINIREKFTNDIIYKVMNLREKEQKKYIFDMLNNEESQFLKKLLDLNNFKIRKLISNLDTFIQKNDPKIYIHTGDKEVNYDSININIKTLYDENINEGIKIYYKGVLYDYSL